MDGTLVDSARNVVSAWQWAATELDLPYPLLAPYVHGIPAGQVLAEVAPMVPAEERSRVVAELLARQTEDTSGVVAMPGAWAALDALPTKRWAVVTSADDALARARLRAAGLPPPRHLITAELTEIGKPAPDPFLLAARRLGFPPERCLVVEDSPAGVAAGKAAGCPVLGVLSSGERLPGTVHAVTDLRGARFEADRLGVHARVAG